MKMNIQEQYKYQVSNNKKLSESKIKYEDRLYEIMIEWNILNTTAGTYF